jgi:hypothetical protein
MRGLYFCLALEFSNECLGGTLHLMLLFAVGDKRIPVETDGE